MAYSARTVQVIKNQIVAEKQAQAELGGLTSTSKAAKWNLWAYIVAVCTQLFEQILAVYMGDIDSKIQVAGVGTAPWLREQILRFQSGDVVKFNTTTFITGYPVIDTTKRIITRCSVSTVGKNEALIRVAKNEPPEALSGSELTELIGYAQYVEFAGTNITIKTFNSDKLFLKAIVYYKGEYATVIQANVIDALNSYLANISSAVNFGGRIKINAIIDTIQNVEGVTDVKLQEAGVRADIVPFLSRTVIYNLATGVNLVSYDSISGYVVQETQSGQTFANQLTFTVDA